MTAASTSMRLLVQKPASRPVVESSSKQPSPSGADETARRLAAAVARGNETAFQELYDRYHRRLFRLALMLARGDDSIAHDTVQSVFVTAAAKLRRVESEAHLWNWLARVARQQLVKARRQRSNNSVVVAMADLPELPDVVETDSALEEHLDAALLLLTSEEHQIIECFYFDRLTHKEIADELHLTPKAVSGRLERVRAKLRSWMIRSLSRET